MSGIIIVGAGHAAVQLVTSLRQNGFDGALTIFGDEPHPPYQRPPLSKTYMKEADAGRLVLKSDAFFERNAIDLRSGTRIHAIDRAGKMVESDGGERFAYDHLVLATGATNIRPPIAGADHPGLFELRTLAHADRIREHLATARTAIVVGGGFIGLEFAAMAANLGVRSTVLEAGPRLMARAVSPSISERFLDYHRSIGVECLLDSAAREIVGSGNGAVESVRLADGRSLVADLVLVAAGVRPNTALAENAGLEVENGIVVDGTLATADPSISAIGDCASVPTVDGIHQRLESVQAASDQARHLAARLAGSPSSSAYRAVPWFWSDQGDLKLQIAGLPSEADTFDERAGDGSAITVLGYRGDRLASVETVNTAGDHMAARRLLDAVEPPSRAAIEDAGHDLRALAKAMAGVRPRIPPE